MCRLDLESKRVETVRSQLAQRQAAFRARREAEAAAQAAERLRQQQCRDREARRQQQRLQQQRQVEVTKLVREFKEMEAAAREVAMQLKAEQHAQRLKVPPHPPTSFLLTHPLNTCADTARHRFVACLCSVLFNALRHVLSAEAALPYMHRLPLYAVAQAKHAAISL